MLARLRAASPGAPFSAAPGSAWYQYFAALRAEAGMPEWLTPHVLRASAASHCETTEEACRLLGHSDPQTTEAHYRDPRVAGDGSLPQSLERPRRSWLAWIGLAS